MTSQKDIAKKQAEIVGQLQQFLIGRTNSGGRAGGMVEVVITNPLPGQPSVVQAKCANDCPPGDIQVIKADDGSYVALSPNAARSTGESTTRDVSKKNKVKPKKKDEEIWPVTSCFLYSRIKPVQEKLTGNGAAQESQNETSWDGISSGVYSAQNSSSYAIGFVERLDTLGDYATAADALANKLKPDRLISPPNENSSAAKDNAANSANSEDSVTIWFYIGDPADAFLGGQIFKVSGTPAHPSTSGITDSGPGFVMQVYGSGIASAIFPKELIGEGPLTKKLKETFPGIGGKIGYAGQIAKWHGMQDYISTSLGGVYYFRETPAASEPNQEPISYPAWFNPQGSIDPWAITGATWFQFGWPDPQYSGCASSGWINANSSALVGIECGSSIQNDQWYWGGGATPSSGRIDRSNPSGFIATNGMYVCWKGHIDNAEAIVGYFEAFRQYWGIEGSVTKLGSANPYGCEIPGSSGGGYPPAPTGQGRRFLIDVYGRKAETWLKICKGNDPPIDLKLPFEYAAIMEKMTVAGGYFSSNLGYSPTKVELKTFGALNSDLGFGVELIHGTLSIDAEYAYVDIFYGAERVVEDGDIYPVPIKIGYQGFGAPPGINVGEQDLQSQRNRRPGNSQNGLSFYANSSTNTLNSIQGISTNSMTAEDLYLNDAPATRAELPNEKYARIIKDCFTSCQSYKIKLPTANDKSATIVNSQKYKRGEDIEITAPNPDNEFNSKFLIYDFRTDVTQTRRVSGESSFMYTSAHKDAASFGGLPALIQPIIPSSNTIHAFNPNDTTSFYKEKKDWTELDWIYYQLMEMPRQIKRIDTVLPPGVTTFDDRESPPLIIFDADTKFGRNGRAEVIIPASGFNNTNSSSPNYPKLVINSGRSDFHFLFTVFGEQLKGNGLKINGKTTNWYRVCASSFPSCGQVSRNF